MPSISTKEIKTRYSLAILAATMVPLTVGFICSSISIEDINLSCYRSFSHYDKCLIASDKANPDLILVSICGYFLVIGGLFAGAIGTFKVFRRSKSTAIISADKINTIAVHTTLWAHMWLVIMVTSDEFILGSPMRPGSWQLGDYFFSLPFVAFASIPFLAIALALGLLAGTLFKWVVYRPIKNK